MNDGSRGTYNSNNQIRCKTLVLTSSLCDYIDAYVLVSATITISRGPDDATEVSKRADKRNKK